MELNLPIEEMWRLCAYGFDDVVLFYRVRRRTGLFAASTLRGRKDLDLREIAAIASGIASEQCQPAHSGMRADVKVGER